MQGLEAGSHAVLALAGLDGLVTRSRYEEVTIYEVNLWIPNIGQNCESSKAAEQFVWHHVIFIGSNTGVAVQVATPSFLI